MVLVLFDIVSSSDKWSNLAQPDGDNKAFKKTCYSNHFFRTHTISNILEFFYITRTNLQNRNFEKTYFVKQPQADNKN